MILSRILKLVFLGTLLAPLFFSISGCSLLEARENRKHLEEIRIGMNKDEVRSIMGEPLVGEVYNTPQVWYYYTQHAWYDGLTTRDECTPLVFSDDNRLVAWGYDYLKENYTVRDWSQNAINQNIPVLPGFGL